MNFIDKRNKHFTLRANNFVNAFINTQRKGNKECKYFLFCKTPYKNKLQDLLIEEQHERCCYCMRKLNHDNTTIEHVIPKSSNEDAVNAYLQQENVVFGHVKYEASLKRFAYPPYPHQIAYGNMCASCKGILKENSTSSFSCNCKRLNKTITPLMFMPNISNTLEYMSISGEVVLHTDDSSHTLEELGLNNETLKEIRMIWALIAKNKSKQLIKQNRKYDLLSNLFHVASLGDLNNSELSTFVKYFTSPDDYYWNLLKDYNWFYSYFRKKSGKGIS